MFRDWRRRRRIGKIKPGGGRALKPFRWWQLFSRHLFYLDLAARPGAPDPAAATTVAAPPSNSDPHLDAGGVQRYAVHVNWWSWDDDGNTVAELYRDGRQLSTAPVPAIFPVPGGTIEVALSELGLKRMHHVTDDGASQTLTPDPRSGEGLRARFGQHYPRASTWIGHLAVLVLIAAAAVELPQLLELITSWEVVEERMGTFESPITLPAWANITIVAVSILAGMERALTLRHHWLIDGGAIIDALDP
ncbi:hypothetical protein [Bogoriella caseilytica]|uniref:Uncharacterized protein n=1 Tax=Bogoriella caseilytica TaxID=56055 RepID=A0A3N2BBZ5_9MICO|nr:hypothetical protein [Bogoriella caseilytica]ROR72748.1 hypothetical protein EDD31_1107 [Bogoriella caseilytica]